MDKNIIFDGTGKDYDWYFNDVIHKLKREEYIVTIGIISNNVNITSTLDSHMWLLS